MKTRRRVLSMNLMQVFRFPVFYLSILGVSMICWLSIKEYYVNSYGDVNYFFDLFVELAMLKKLVVLMAAIPFAASFCSDWNCQYIKPVVIRSGLFRYSFAKVFTCFLSSFLVVFLGLCLFFVILSTQIPLYPDSVDQFATPPYIDLVKGAFPVLYILAKAFIFSLAAAFWSVVGLAVSAYVPNRFVAISTPIIASYILEVMTGFLPAWLNLYCLTRSTDVLQQGAIVSFGYFFLVFIVLSCLAGLVFHHQVRRRMRNEFI